MKTEVSDRLFSLLLSLICIIKLLFDCFFSLCDDVVHRLKQEFLHQEVKHQ